MEDFDTVSEFNMELDNVENEYNDYYKDAITKFDISTDIEEIFEECKEIETY